jgi:hypothetical protein
MTRSFAVISLNVFGMDVASLTSMAAPSAEMLTIVHRVPPQETRWDMDEPDRYRTAQAPLPVRRQGYADRIFGRPRPRDLERLVGIG